MPRAGEEGGTELEKRLFFEKSSCLLGTTPEIAQEAHVSLPYYYHHCNTGS